jgi:uncharacterized protein YfaS (alpha-2-macroglobulin family)
VTVSGTLAQPPPATNAGLRLEKRFYALDGSPLDPASLKQGQQVIVRLSGQADSQRAMQAVVDDPLPAGLEIEAVLRPADAQGVSQTHVRDEDGDAPAGQQKAAPGRFAFLGKLDEPSLQEKRDDRYVAALTLADGKPFALAYVARAVTPGDFFLPGADARAMYRPAINAHTASGRLRVAVGP